MTKLATDAQQRTRTLQALIMIEKEWPDVAAALIHTIAVTAKLAEKRSLHDREHAQKRGNSRQ